MKKKTPSNESGQIIVILAIALVVLLAFTALAIDVGMAYADRTISQNVADSAAMAGAQEGGTVLGEGKINCNAFGTLRSRIESAAINQAAMNDVTITAQASEAALRNAKNGVYVRCNATNPATVDVMVMVTQDTETSFMQLFNRNEVTNTVEAISRLTPSKAPQPLVDGAGLVSTAPSGQGIRGNGGGNDGVDLTLLTGDIFVNSSSSDAIRVNGHYGVSPTNGHTYIVGNYDAKGNAHVDNAVIGVKAKTFLDLPEPDCSASSGNFGVDGPNKSTGNSTSLNPGVYKATQITGKTLAPGLYCVTGSGNVGLGTKGKDVMLFFVDNGGIDAAGKGEVGLRAPSSSFILKTTDGSLVDFKGMLMLMNPSHYEPGSKDITLSGNATMVFNDGDVNRVGTIYAPNCAITLNGNGAIVTPDLLQIIVYKITLNGNGTLSYNSDTSRWFMNDGEAASLSLLK